MLMPLLCCSSYQPSAPLQTAALFVTLDTSRASVEPLALEAHPCLLVSLLRSKLCWPSALEGDNAVGETAGLAGKHKDFKVWPAASHSVHPQSGYALSLRWKHCLVRACNEPEATL